MCKINLKSRGFKHAPCPTCLGLVNGRRDKIFCSLKCKNEHHRVARLIMKSRFDELQKRLHRNIIVLEGILGPKNNNMEVHKNVLFKRGFDKDSCTSAFKRNRQLFYEIGNYVFTILRNGIVRVERTKELSEFMPVFFRRWSIEFPDNLVVNGA